MVCASKGISKEIRQFLECLNEFSAHLAVRHPDVALPSVLTTHYHQICSTEFPFDLPMQSVTYHFNTSDQGKSQDTFLIYPAAIAMGYILLSWKLTSYFNYALVFTFKYSILYSILDNTLVHILSLLLELLKN